MRNIHLLAQSPALTEEHFKASFWYHHQAVTGTSGGRNTVWFIAPQAVVPKVDAPNEWVLRHYYRGGLPGKLIRRSFLYTGLARTRAVAEYTLLQQMYEKQLPVPKPVAALVARTGLRYQASLLIERIPNSRDLGRLLLKQPLTSDEWRLIGATVRRFHLAGVYHSDLNCKNILWRGADQETFLIDFDRCGMKAVPNEKSQVLAWQRANLKRLLRSFEKEQTNTPSGYRFHWQRLDWQAFMAGYLQTS